MHIGEFQEYLLSATNFPRQSHSGVNIKKFLMDLFSRFDIAIEDIGSVTLDGASNGLKAMKLMNVNYRVCFIHDVARAVHYAMTADNDDMASVIKSHKRFAALCHRSHVVHDAMFRKQTAMRGEGHELELIQMKGGKWGSQCDCLHRNLLLKPCIKSAISSLLEVDESGDEGAVEQVSSQPLLVGACTCGMCAWAGGSRRRIAVLGHRGPRRDQLRWSIGRIS